jgi:hypothetical protein
VEEDIIVVAVAVDGNKATEVAGAVVYLLWYSYLYG